MTCDPLVNDPWREPTALDRLDAFDREIRDMQQAVDVARRNPWFGGDILAPELEPLLAAIVAPRRGVGRRVEAAPLRSRSWRPF